MKARSNLRENDFWLSVPALNPLCDGHRVCLPKTAERGFLECGTVLYHEGIKLILSDIDQLQEAYQKPVFLYEEINPARTEGSPKTTTDKYLNLLPIEGDLYGAFRFLQDRWQSFDSLPRVRRYFQKQKRMSMGDQGCMSHDHNRFFAGNDAMPVQGYQLAGLFSKAGSQLAYRSLYYPIASHYLKRMVNLYQTQKSQETLSHQSLRRRYFFD